MDPGKATNRTVVTMVGTPEEVCDFLNDLWLTKYFSNVYKANEKDIDKMAEDRGRIVELFGYTMRNELIMPGKVIASNAMFQQGDSAVIWKVDAFRLLAGDYELAAESRIPNGHLLPRYWLFYLLSGFRGELTESRNKTKSWRNHFDRTLFHFT